MASTGSVLVGAAVLSSLALYQGAVRRSDEPAFTGQGAGPGPCRDGGATPVAAEDCSISFGTLGLLRALNAHVRTRLGPAPWCMDHVAAMQAELSRHPQLRAEPVYTCPASLRGKGQCHASVLVTDAQGLRYVVDNGGIVAGTLGVDGVTPFATFAEVVEGLMWIGTPPSTDEVLAAAPELAGFVK